MPRARVTFAPVLPKSHFDAKLYRDQWEKTMRQRVKPDLQSMFKDTVEGWEEKPIFRGTINKSSHFLRLLVKAVGKNADKYEMIDITGAKAHLIRPKNAPLLKYRPGYVASTRPRVLKSRRKRRSGPLVTASVVRHPGFEAREFSATIAEEYQPRFAKLMQESTFIANAEQARRF